MADVLVTYGVTRDFVTRCNEEGLLTPGLPGARTVFLEQDELRLKLILRGRALGFTLSEIRELLAMGPLMPKPSP